MLSLPHFNMFEKSINPVKRIIDLTLTLRHGMRGVSFETKYTLADKGWNAQTYHLYSHCGTHLDAPVHYNVSDKAVADIAPHRFISTAWVADLTGIESRHSITVTDMRAIARHVSAGDSILIKTGWSEKINTPQYRDELPGISEELAHWCVDKKINMLGVEPPAIADPNNIPDVQKIHKILLNGDIIIVEGLCNLTALSKNKVTFLAMPLKIARGDGSPIRALAIENDEDIL